MTLKRTVQHRFREYGLDQGASTSLFTAYVGNRILRAPAE